ESWPLPSRQQRPVRRVARSARPEGRRGGFSQQPRSRKSRAKFPDGAGRLRPVGASAGALRGAQKSPEPKRALAGGPRKRGRRTRSHRTPEQTETVAPNCQTLRFCSGSRISRRKA
ncbi:mCG145949, partial [Mus musculus]